LGGVRVRRGVAIGVVVMSAFAGACTNSTSSQPPCNRPEDRAFVLIAQAVPTATKLPCITGLPAGWRYGGSLIRDDLARMWLDSDLGGTHAVQIDLVGSCDTSDAVEVPPGPGEAGARVFQQPRSLPPLFVATRYVVFEGGCLRTQYDFHAGAPASLAIEADTAVAFLPRSTVARITREEFGLTLCGAGEPPCAGPGG
jgi:hypothetical protein